MTTKTEIQQQYTQLMKLYDGSIHDSLGYLASIRLIADSFLQTLDKTANDQATLSQQGQYLKAVADAATSYLQFMQVQSHPEKAKDITLQPIDLSQCIPLCLEQYAPRGGNKEAIRLSLQPGLLVMGHEVLLRQTLFNLLNNAFYAISGNPDADILICSQAIGNRIQLFVRDNGCGISREAVKLVFDEGYTTKTKTNGTGKGLSICHEFVKRMGGNIECDSKEGEYTCFTINFSSIKGDDIHVNS